jgi:LytS/YehU family sensor histidine kinase
MLPENAKAIFAGINVCVIWGTTHLAMLNATILTGLIMGLVGVFLIFGEDIKYVSDSDRFNLRVGSYAPPIDRSPCERSLPE